ncbi:MAG TPA: DNA methyltransferase, partial [Pyrinomonadaceae bacterium]|nr:DNA methyltransferase [Pyrinomonadaceae bacterium]
TEGQLALLTEASRLDWRDVEPAIFGTLLERALDPTERRMLGAHYTPRAYVERLVMPTVIEPLREEWDATLAAAVTLHAEGRDAEAARAVKEFHRRLCRVRVLDPACGSGNFLYVTLEHLKRLEGEVLDALHGFGERQGILEDTGMTVDPHQLLGLEVNPRAAAIADLVLWIGYLQWHFRTRGEAMPPEPVLKEFHNIEERDAVLAYDAVEAETDEAGQPVTRWDGRTYKKHAVTGEDVPDETARVALKRYVNPRPAVWPEADFIVGNPPFIGNKRMRQALGDGYVEALRQSHKDVSDTVDYVMYWWDRAARLLHKGSIQRFGFITTNSITQPFNRKVLENHLEKQKGLSLYYAVPDHPWVDSAGGASVRIAMTVCGKGDVQGIFEEVVHEANADLVLAAHRNFIHPDLTIGTNVTALASLASNSLLSGQGVIVLGEGFLLTSEEAVQLLKAEPEAQGFIKRYRNGKDIMQTSRNINIIDLFGVETEEELIKYPHIYQRIYNLVRPARLEMKDKARREKWWLFGRSNKEIRAAISGLDRYIATCRTAKHRVFIFLDGDILPDAKIVAIGLDSSFHLGILSSRIHTYWALRTGAFLEDRPNYNHADCFNKFPFPIGDETQQARIRELGEQLDAHRKRQQAQHPSLTLTEMYNVLERLRAGKPLTERERVTHEQGLVSVLRQLHDELDAAVGDAYGWPDALSDEEILERLVNLNAERAAEERRGQVRWLRPDFQRPASGVAAEFGEDFEPAATAAAKEKKQLWPKSLPEQARALRQMLAAQKGVVTPQQLARKFTRARVERVEELLQTLVSLGQAREVETGRYTA